MMILNISRNIPVTNDKLFEVVNPIYFFLLTEQMGRNTSSSINKKEKKYTSCSIPTHYLALSNMSKCLVKPSE